MRPSVLLDVDGVLADFTSAALELVFKETGRRYEPNAVTTWEVFDSIPEPFAQARVYGLLKGRGGCLGIPIYEGAQDGVARLRELADVTIVTSPFSGSETWMHEREKWLEQHFGIDHHDIIHAKKKSRVHGDIFIDDKPEHIEGWLQYWSARGLEVMGLLWGTDRTIGTPSHLTKVTDWETVLQLVRVLANK